MDISTMTMEQVDQRLSEIDLDAEGADLEALSAEMDALKARKEAIKAAAEARQQELDAVAAQPKENPIMEEERMADKTFTPDSPEYREAWLCKRAGIPLTEEERAAMATVDVVPTTTVNDIINRLKANDLLKYIDMWHVKGNVNIPNYTTNLDAAWGDSGNERQDVIGHVALNLYTLIKTVEIPGKYERNAIDAFESKMIEALVNKAEAALQKAVIVGAGSTEPTGIATTHSTADGTFTNAGITKGDLMTIMGALGAEYQKDAVWIMPNKVFYEAMAVCDLPGFVALNAELKPIIGGKPVIVDDNCIISSTDTVFYGAAKAYHMNISTDISVDRDESVGFKTGAVNYRVMAFADGKLDNAAAFVKYTRATASSH